MKFSKIIFLVFLIIGFAVICFFYQTKEDIGVPIGTKSEIEGSVENPQARAEYDWIRLRNPVTKRIPEDIRKKERKFAESIPSKEQLASEGMVKQESVREICVYNWERRGPVNIGGRTRALGLYAESDAPEGELTILAGGTSSGMWRSDNGGSSWYKVTDVSDLHSVSCIAHDTRQGKENIWYYGTGEIIGNSASDRGYQAFYSGDGIFKSTDGGKNWELLSSTSTRTPHLFDSMFDYIINLAIDPSNSLDDEIYAAAYGGILRSINGGESWVHILGDPLDGNEPYYSDVAITSNGVVYAVLSNGNDEGVWRSTDGIDWVDITPDTWPEVYDRFVIGIAPSNENVVYFLGEATGTGIEGGNLWKYTFISNDGSGSGGTWVNLSQNLPNYGGSTGTFSSQGSYNLIVKVKPDNENVVFVGDINLWRSTDGFSTTWNTTKIGGYAKDHSVDEYPNHHMDLHAIEFLATDPNVMFTGSDGGVHRTDNNMASNVNWNSLNNGFYTTQFYTVALDHNSTSDIIIGGMQDNGTMGVFSGNLSDSWMEIYSGDGAYCAIANGEKLFYVSAQEGSIYRMEFDNQLELIDWTKIKPSNASDFIFIAPFVMDPNDNNIIYLADGPNLWRNSDVSEIESFSNDPTSVNWTKLENASPLFSNISSLAICRTPQNRLYYGTSSGELYRVENVNSGDPASVKIFDESDLAGYIHSITVHPNDGDKLMFSFSNYGIKSIFYSNDAGNSWTDVSGNLEQYEDGSGNGPSVRSVLIMPYEYGDIYFAGTSTGLYSTSELKGTSTEWIQEGTSTIGKVVVEMVKGRTNDQLIAAATHATGIFSTSLTTGIDDEIITEPDNFVLKQNYPNPFNPETTIEFELPKAIPVNLEVYNELGQKVRTITYDKRFSAGTHRVLYNGRDDRGRLLSSGVYFYRIKAGNFTKVKKMVMLK